MFYIQIVNLDAGSYLCMTPEKALSNAEKENKNLYLQAFLECRKTFTPMVYSADGIPGAEAKNQQGYRRGVGGGVELPQGTDTPGVAELPWVDETPGVTTAGEGVPEEYGRWQGGNGNPPRTRATKA